LGYLLAPKRESKKKRKKKQLANWPDFQRYWSKHLYTSKPRKEVGGAVYRLARNGIAHSFAAKSPIEISTTEQDKNHLVKVEEDVFRVDAKVLARDFEHSYKDSFRSWLTNAGARQSAEARFEELLEKNARSYTSELRRALERLPNLVADVVTAQP